MIITPTEIPGVLIIEPKVFGDDRGSFVETWRSERYAAAGMSAVMVQDNVSRSTRGVLRGLHYQHPHAQAKLVYPLEGEILDVACDIRRGSPTFGRYVATVLSSQKMRQLYVPEGFAHGFCVLSETAIVAYKCSTSYRPEFDRGIAWNDPDVAVAWPIADPLLSPKDARLPVLRDVPPELLPEFSQPAVAAASS